MTTPEGKVKTGIDALLKKHGAYYLKPVQSGLGAPGLDYHGVHKGIGFAIEAKRPGGKPTARQCETARRILKAGGAVFLIDGDLTELEKWLTAPRTWQLTIWAQDLLARTSASPS